VQATEVREAFAKRNLMGHLEALQKIADQEGGNRAAGTSGYEASARYVENQLRAAGYTPVRQVFTYEDENLEADRETFNILADTAGSADHTVVVGGHLDSVPEGPGINDNASGVAAMLETARWMAETGVEPKNRVRFAFWGAEEVDLLGSQHYVDELSASEISRTAVNINIDMAASPNGVRFVHDGDGSSFGDAAPAGSPGLESILLDYFAKNSLAAEATVFNGDSDYDAFFQAGIATGGLFAGDVGTKTSEQAQKFGGTVNQDHDPCYHEACDTIDNVNQELLKDMAGALGYATLAFAMTQM
jgi:aminopeptidase S